MTADDITAITQLMNLYGHFMDQAQSERYRRVGRALRFDQVFTSDVVFSFDGAVLEGETGIMSMLGPFPDGEEGAVAHCVTNVVVYEEDGATRVHAKWFVPVRETGGIGTGDYHNVVRRTPEGWRIASVDARVRHFPGGTPPIADPSHRA